MFACQCSSISVESSCYFTLFIWLAVYHLLIKCICPPLFNIVAMFFVTKFQWLVCTQYFIYYVVFAGSRVLSIIAHVGIPLLFCIFNSCNVSNVHDKCMLRSVFTLAFFLACCVLPSIPVQPFLTIFRNILYSSKPFLSP